MGVCLINLASQVPALRLPEKEATAAIAARICTVLGRPVNIAPDGSTVYVDSPLVDTVIVIDPCPGGPEDPGAAPADSMSGGYTLEARGLLALSTLLAERLHAAGATVHVTRQSGDAPSATDRVSVVRSLAPDLVIGLHTGTFQGFTANRTAVFYGRGGGRKASILAASLDTAMAAATAATTSGTQLIWGVPSDEHMALIGERRPVVIVQLANHQRAFEEQLLSSPEFLDDFARGLWLGVVAALSRWHKRPLPLPLGTITRLIKDVEEGRSPAPPLPGSQGGQALTPTPAPVSATMPAVVRQPQVARITIPIAKQESSRPVYGDVAAQMMGAIPSRPGDAQPAAPDQAQPAGPVTRESKAMDILRARLEHPVPNVGDSTVQDAPSKPGGG